MQVKYQMKWHAIRDQQFVEEFTSVPLCSMAKSTVRPFVDIVQAKDGSDETSDWHDDWTGAVCDIPLEHRSVDVDENDFVEGFRNKTCQCSKLYGV